MKSNTFFKSTEYVDLHIKSFGRLQIWLVKISSPTGRSSTLSAKRDRPSANIMKLDIF